MISGMMLGWRDGILILVALAAIYLVFMLLRLLQVGRLRAAAGGATTEPTVSARFDTHFDTVSPLRPPVDNQTADPELAGAAGVSAYAAMNAYATALEDVPAQSAQSAQRWPAAAAPPAGQPDSHFAVPPAPTFEWDEVKSLFGENLQDAQDAPDATAVSAGPAAHPPGQGERGSGFGEPLAAHLARSGLESEILRMREEMERMRREVEELRAARRVSPHYAEAMELAQNGLAAQDVADRMSISLAEAELIQALSRSRQDFEEGETDGHEGVVARVEGFQSNARRRG